MNQRLIAISDIHGYYEEFIELMKKVDYKKGVDKLYILGDMIDRGKDSFKTMTLIRNLQRQYPETVHVILGNHDSEFLNIIKLLRQDKTLDEDGWVLYAGFTDDDLQTLAVYSELLNDNDKDKLIEWLESLPYYVEDGDFIFVHAAIDSKLPLDKQDPQYMLWGKYGKEKYSFIYDKMYDNKVVVFGHVYTETLYKMNNEKLSNNVWYDIKNYDKIGIDCGIWTGKGKLGALIITPGSRIEEDTFEDMYVDLII